MSFQYHTGNVADLKLAQLAQSYPFLQQVDIVFPSNDALDGLLSKLKAHFFRGELHLSDIRSNYHPGLTCLSTGSHEDVWCVDPRGVLTLSTTKETYETLGLTGGKVVVGYGKKHPSEERHVITIPLEPITQSAAAREKQDRCLKALDSRSWNVLCTSTNLEELGKLATTCDATVHAISFERSILHDIHVPNIRESNLLGNDEQWQENVHSLFEWIGMAGIGSQRLQVHDRVDAFISSYRLDLPHGPGTITRLKWKGFFGPGFTQALLDSIISLMPQFDFVCITATGCDMNPVPRLPRTAFRANKPNEQQRAPLVNPAKGKSDTWSFALASSSEQQEHRWILASGY